MDVCIRGMCRESLGAKERYTANLRCGPLVSLEPSRSLFRFSTGKGGLTSRRQSLIYGAAGIAR